MEWREKTTTGRRSSTSSAVMLLLVTGCLLLSCCNGEFHPDYSDSDGFQGNSQDASLNLSGSDNDEIYEPAILQQEVEKEQEKQQKNQMDDMETMPRNDFKSHQINATTYAQINHMSSYENYVEPLSNNERPANTSMEYEDSEMKQLKMNTITPNSLHAVTSSPFAIKMKQAHSSFESDEIIDPNSSISEYMDEYSYLSSSEKQQPAQQALTSVEEDPKSTTIEPPETSNSEKSQINNNEFIPIPMKYYQVKQLEQEIQKLEEALRKNHTDEENASSNKSEVLSASDEEYYLDSNEMDKYSTTTTSSTSTSSTPSTFSSPSTTEVPPTSKTAGPQMHQILSQQIPITIARAALSGNFLLPWQSTTTTTPPSTTAPSTPATPPSGNKALKVPSLRALFPKDIKSATLPSVPEYYQSLATEEPEEIDFHPQTYSIPSTSSTASPITEAPPVATTTTTTAPSTSTTPPTTTRPKHGKQINIAPSRRLLPHEQLHNYIEDAYVRTPLAVIVDPSAECLEKTKVLWNEALHTNLNIKIIMVSLNASGIPSSYNFNNTRQFLSGLNSIKEHDGGNSFVGILHAAELVPYDSAIYVSTAVVPRHDDLVQDAAITLLKKRIRLYLIWYGEKSLTENETQETTGGILGEVAIRSGGEVLHIVGDQNSQEIEGSTLTIVADALRGSQEVEVPVDTTLSSLHVKLDAPMRQAYLQTPYGG